MAVSATAMVLALTAVHAALPTVTHFLKNNTGIYESFEQSLAEKLSVDEGGDLQEPSGQRALIENMELPIQIKDALLENNNNEVYSVLGVDTFSQYIARYLANSIVNIIGFLVLFVVVFALLRIVAMWLDLVARLPILSGLNKIAGALLGGAEGLLLLWLLGLFVMIFAGTEPGRLLLRQIQDSVWLSFLYEHNILAGFAMAVAKNIL